MSRFPFHCGIFYKIYYNEFKPDTQLAGAKSTIMDELNADAIADGAIVGDVQSPAQ